MGILRIELLEDCEMNSGRVVNSLFSDDVFFDGFGLPCIPAWVIRNSFVKTIENEPTLLNDGEVEALVGKYASLSMDNALVADRESMRQAILADPHGDILLRNPQTVLNASGFTKVKKTSGLSGNSYVRMLAKDTIFEAYLELDDSCVAAFRRLVAHMRSLFVGYEVRARFSFDEDWQTPRFVAAPPVTVWDGERLRLKYELHVLTHMTTLDHISGEFVANPYVSGKGIRDALASRDELAGIFDDEANAPRCSYAYIEVRGRRGLPIPASYSTKKQDKNDLRDRCSRGRRPHDFDQIKGMGTLFIDDPDNTEVHAMSVRKEQAIARYYQDGSFEDASFCAIGHAQTFEGFIEGSRDDIERIYESIMEKGCIRIGHLTNLGFGSVYIQVKSVAPVKNADPELVEEATVLLASPARLYRNGLYEASAQNVLEEVQSRLGGGVELEIVRNSQKTCLVAEYNKAWGELEPLEYAMQAGSIYRLRAKDRSMFDIAPVMGGIFIGGHTDVGYGETWVMPAVDAYYRHITYESMSAGDFPVSYKVDPNPGRRLMRRLYQVNANAMASHLGAIQAESYVADTFRPGPLSDMRGAVSEDLDEEQLFESYIEALKEAGLNAIRRGQRD